ncbi:MAG: hypothetical protein JWQ07_5665 [Ramlibacter sp.]|jgi:hypothetical protein|nr:hypothetical protein [Ramlibacter sp.]
MDRYFFDLRDNGLLVVDECGFEISDMRAVEKQAALLLIELNHDRISNNKAGLIDVEVRDGDGSVMEARLTFHFVNGAG